MIKFSHDLKYLFPFHDKNLSSWLSNFWGSYQFPWLDLMSNDITKAAKPLTVKNIKGEAVPLKVVNNFIFELILESLKSDDIDSLLIKYDKIFRKDILKE